MPEGPEIRRAADQLAAALGSEPLINAAIYRPGLEHTAKDLIGRRVSSITTRGKAMLTRFDHGLTLYSHNQLYGVWKVAKSGERPQTTRSLRVVLETDKKALLLYSASDIALLDADGLSRHAFLQRLGPDVLDEETTAGDVLLRLQDPRYSGRQLGALLLDQGFLAGLGNYLRSEVLFHAGLLPMHRPRDLDAAERTHLASVCLDVPRRSYRSRGRRGKTYSENGAFRFAVFDREGEPCLSCGNEIQRQEVASRRLYWCPVCQA